VLHLMRAAADQLGVPLDATAASLKTQLSRWENGGKPSAFYTDLLCTVYGLPSPAGPVATVRRYRCGNSAVYRRVLGTKAVDA
jgi:hypothetical protein